MTPDELEAEVAALRKEVDRLNRPVAKIEMPYTLPGPDEIPPRLSFWGRPLGGEWTCLEGPGGGGLFGLGDEPAGGREP